MEKIEFLILKCLINNEDYSRKVLPFIKSEYFEDNSEKTVFLEIQSFMEHYNKLPTKEVLHIELDKNTNLTDETLLKRKRIPQVYFNSICYFDFDENIDQIINVSNLELKFLEWSKDIPLPPPAYDVNNVDTKNKMQIVINMIKETEFTHDEKLALIILIIATLKE